MLVEPIKPRMHDGEMSSNNFLTDKILPISFFQKDYGIIIITYTTNFRSQWKLNIYFYLNISSTMYKYFGVQSFCIDSFNY